jgi:drug/metabolite transporter (DMT)-like permease
MSPERRAILLMVAFAALWTIVEALAGRVLKQYSPFQVVWTRYAVHLALMLAIWGWRAPSALWRTRRPVYQLARSSLMVVMPASWVFGTRMADGGGLFLAIFWLSPLLIVAMARLFLRERVSAFAWGAAGAATLGAIAVNNVVLPPSALWLAFPLAMGLSFSAYVVMTRPLRDEDVRANLFYTAFGVFIVLTPAMPGLWIAPDLHDLAIMVGVGVLGYVCLYALDRAAAAAPVALTAPAAAMQVAFIVVLHYGFRIYDPRILLGFLLIIAATAAIWARPPLGLARPHGLDAA